MTVTLLEYAQIANQVYGSRAEFRLAGWDCHELEVDQPFLRGGKLWSNGFQGGCFHNRSRNELVIAFKGTVRSMATDLLADLTIAVQRIPAQADTALRCVDRWRSMAPGARVTLTGHSLGGGLCQVVGSWRGLPYVTFNAPAMGTHWLLAHANITAPVHMVRTILGRRRDDSVNYRLLNDPVSKLGTHIGRVVKINGGCSVSQAHFMDNFLRVIQRDARLARTDPLA